MSDEHTFNEHADSVNGTENNFGDLGISRERAMSFRIFEYQYVHAPTVALPRFSPTTPSH